MENVISRMLTYKGSKHISTMDPRQVFNFKNCNNFNIGKKGMNKFAFFGKTIRKNMSQLLSWWS
jgi:hypothetical protein